MLVSTELHKVLVMKKMRLILLSSVAIAYFVLFFSGCQTKTIRLIPEGGRISIQKITEKGIESISLEDKGEVWPAILREPVKTFNASAGNLKIAFIGDTGCRLKEFNDRGEYQNCNDSDLWPFAKISRVIAKEKYDFLVHVGDYFYREKCSNKLFCDKYTNTSGPNWKSWWEDFYKPAAPLLEKSPILFVRGNHEDCKRGFQGWAPLSFKQKDFLDACESYEGFQIIDFSDLIFVNFDNSDFEDKKKLKPEEEKLWSERLSKLKEKLDKHKGKEIWLIVHKPLHAFLKQNQGGGEISAIPSQFKDLVKKVGLEAIVDVVVSGHIHAQEVTYFAENKTQIIVGHTATLLDPIEHIVKRKDFYSTTATHKDFGYLIAERKSFKKWNLEFKNVNGANVLNCQLDNKKFSCK